MEHDFNLRTNFTPAELEMGYVNPGRLVQDYLMRLLRDRKEYHFMSDVLVDISISVAAVISPLSVDASGVPATATVGQPYSGALKVSGGVSPYTFTDVSAAQNPPAVGFPPGVVLNSDGTITGTPTTAGAYAAVVDVADSASVAVAVAVKSVAK